MRMITSFSLAALPQLWVGSHALEFLPKWLYDKGYCEVLVCIGGSSFEAAGHLVTLMKGCRKKGIKINTEHVSGEPSPALIDAMTKNYWGSNINCVVGIGGGSVIDAAKAAAAMIGESKQLGVSSHITDYLEGVGTKSPTGCRIGLVAVPTTSGTGSEATKNAVISSVGTLGFKKSLRHTNYIPDIALLDGSLVTSCPPHISSASGLDAVTQLLEAYVSTKATPFTDVLALDGLGRAGMVLEGIVDGSLSNSVDARTTMAYAAYLSGVALANANLGVVHGAASALGSFRTIPHGVVCGTLLYTATEAIIHHLKGEEGSAAGTALGKYSKAGYSLTGVTPDASVQNTSKGLELLLHRLKQWEEQFAVPQLGAYEFTVEDIKRLAPKVGLKNTPANLTSTEVETLLLERL